MMFQYLYKNWSHAGILIALYVALVLVCMAPWLDLFSLFVWLQFPVYLVHEFEEHTYPGGFKEYVNQGIFHARDKDVPLNPTRIFWMNILAVWVLFPLTAVATQFVSPFWGLLAPCFSLVNASLHMIGAGMKRSYNPGLLASIFLNYPFGLYCLYIARCEGFLQPAALLHSVFFAVVVHVAMVGLAFYWYRSSKTM